MDSKARESRAYNALKQAEELYAQAEYLRAMEAYDRARRDFVLLGNADMVDTIEDRLKELSELTGKPVTPLSERPPSTPAKTGTSARQGGGGGLLFVLIVVLIVGVGVYLWKFRGEKPAREEGEEQKIPLEPKAAKAEEVRKLKAKFVYGEINRKEYEKKLRELEDGPS